MQQTPLLMILYTKENGKNHFAITIKILCEKSYYKNLELMYLARVIYKNETYGYCLPSISKDIAHRLITPAVK